MFSSHTLRIMPSLLLFRESNISPQNSPGCHLAWEDGCVTCRPGWSHHTALLYVSAGVWESVLSDQYFLLYTCDLTLPGKVLSKFSSVFQADLKLPEDFKRQGHCLILCPILMIHRRNI